MVDPLSYAKIFFRSIFSVFSPSTTTIWQNNIAYSITLHNPRLLLYRGPETYVTFSIYAQAYSAEARKQLDSLSTSQIAEIVKGTNVQLVQKGWIAGVVGWNAAGAMGVATKKGWNVTPAGNAGWKDTQAESGSVSAQHQEDEDYGEKPQRHGQEEYEMQKLGRSSTSSDDVPKETRHIALKRKEKIDKQIRAQSSTISTSDSSSTRVLGTYKCRIPVETGDGYFRFFVTLPSPTGLNRNQIGIPSPTFRLFSLSLTSASPRGAALLPIPVIVPELALRTVSIALTGVLYGLFPVATIIDKLLPRWMSRRFINWIYTRVGFKNKTEQLKDKYQVDQKVEQAKEQVKKVPFASAGIRTAWDHERDAQRGRGGWAYHW